jgi:hypothetical protein
MIVDNVPEAPTAPSPSLTGAVRGWRRRQWVTAVLGALVTAVVIGVPTDVIPNPLFGRPVDVTWWSPPVLVITAVLGGLMLATYVATPGTPTTTGSSTTPGTSTTPGSSSHDAMGSWAAADRPGRIASVGGLLGFLAVGCPVCNKLVVVALGTSGALSWFAPLQPLLAVVSVVVLALALRTRLRGQVVCAVR